MGIVQLEQILQRDDVPSDVKQTVMDHLGTLRESEERPRIFWDTSPDHLVFLDSALNVIDVNKAGLKAFGITHEELIGRNILDFEPTLKGTDRYSKYLEVLQTGKPFFIEDLTPNPKFGDLHLFVRVFKVGDGLGFITTDITDLKLAEQALKESEEKLYKIFEDSPLGMAIIGTHSKIIEANQALCNIIGYSEEEIKTLTFTEFTHPDDLQKDFLETEKLIKREIPFFRLEKRYLTKDKKVVWGNLTATAVFDDNGNFDYGVGMVEDITDKKQAEEFLLESEERLRKLFEAIPMGINLYHLESDGRLVFVDANSASSEILGLDSNQFIGKTVEEAFPSLAKTDRPEIYRRVAAEGKSWQIDQVLYKDKKISGAFEIHAFQTDPEKMAIAFQDITNRKQAEEALLESEERLRALIDSAPDNIILWDSELNYVELNKKSIEAIRTQLKLLLPREEIIGKNILEINPSLKGTDRYNAYKEVLRTGIPFYRDDIEFNDRFFAVRAFKAGSGIGMISRDVTEKRKAEEALQESEKRLKFAQQVAHLGFYDWDVVTGDLYWSDEAFRMFGLEPQEFKMSFDKVMSLLHPEDIEYVREQVKAALDNDAEYNVEVRGLLPSGEIRYFQGRAIVTRDTNGNAIRFIGTQLDITERKHAEIKLQESEEKFRTLMDSATDAITLFDSELNYVIVNKSYIEGLGLSKKEIIGKNILDLFPYLKKTNRYNTYKEVIRTGKPFILEGHKYKDKFFSVRVFKAANGLGMITTDVTEQKKVEEALRYRTHDLGERVKELTCLYGLSKLTSNPESSIDEICQQAIEIIPLAWQYPEITCVQITLKETIYSSDTFQETPWKQSTDIMVSGKKIGSVAVYYLEERPFLKEERDLIDEIGRGLSTFTREKEAVKSLRESEERLRVFMDSATDSFYLIDSNLNIVDINKTALDQLNLKKDNIVGRNITEFRPDLKESGRVEKYLKVIKTGEPLLEENIVSHPSFPSHLKHFSVRSFKVGEGLGILGTDITEQKQAEMVRKELEERREKFIWMASHELRTPLTVISGYFDFWEKNITKLDQDRQDKISITIKSNLRRLEHLIDEVSLIAQFEQGIFKIEKSAFDFNKFFQEVNEEYLTLLGKQLEVNDFQMEFLLIIKGDQNRLRQALDNIVNNAIRHTHPEHRQIKLSLTISPSIIRIIFTDNGAGIAPDNLERIFEQFLSIDTEYAAAGTGIGLYLSRKIMEALGGSLTAQSQGIGHGATFIVELPNIHPE